MPLAHAMAAAKPRPPIPPSPARKSKPSISPPLSGGCGGFWRRRRCFLPRAVSSSLVGEQEEGRGLTGFSEAESHLLEVLLGIQGRGRSATPKQLKEVDRAVEVLEDVGGVSEPTNSKLIEGRWQLMFTTRPGTASPIQRTFVGVDFFSVFQEIYLRTNDPRVSNIVRFSDTIGELKVEAAATVRDEKRILFQFDRAAFSFKFLPFKVPYPVPFRLLGDEAKGWLDTTYLSDKGNLRISRGNKGTTFVLQKIIEPRQRLLSAISMGTGVIEAIDELVSLSQNSICDEVDILRGEWQLLWASQVERPSVYEKVAIGLKGFQTIEKDGKLQNVVELIPGCKVCAKGKLIRTNMNGYHVTMDHGSVIVGTFAFPVAIRKEFTLKLLYADKKIRISQGHKEIILVHLNIGS